eukprot:scaffold36700_cov33-Phaeocystis_antarctica.AAC.1
MRFPSVAPRAVAWRSLAGCQSLPPRAAALPPVKGRRGVNSRTGVAGEGVARGEARAWSWRRRLSSPARAAARHVTCRRRHACTGSARASLRCTRPAQVNNGESTDQ